MGCLLKSRHNPFKVLPMQPTIGNDLRINGVITEASIETPKNIFGRGEVYEIVLIPEDPYFIDSLLMEIESCARISSGDLGAIRESFSNGIRFQSIYKPDVTCDLAGTVQVACRFDLITATDSVFVRPQFSFVDAASANDQPDVTDDEGDDTYNF